MQDHFDSNASSLLSQLQVLGVAGVMGSIARAVLAPKEPVFRRIQQTIVGLLSAIFLGGLIGETILQFVDVGPHALLAAGFVCGTGGEAAISWAQKRILAKKHADED